MKKFLALIMVLALIFTLSACHKEEQSPIIIDEGYNVEILENYYGIAIASCYDDSIFEVEVVWTNLTDIDKSFEDLFIIEVYQNDNLLTLLAYSDTIFTTIEANDTTTVIAQYILNEKTPVTVKLKCNDLNEELLWTYTYDLTATG